MQDLLDIIDNHEHIALEPESWENHEFVETKQVLVGYSLVLSTLMPIILVYR